MAKGLRFSSEAAMPAAMRARLPSAPRTPALPKVPGMRRDDPEHREQVDFILRIEALALRDPRYTRAVKRTFAIPNGGRRSKAEAGRLKAEGVRAGVHDLFCSVERGGYHGLYIEMKASEGRISDKQREWLDESLEEGYAACVCWDAREAFDMWMAYIDGRLKR